MGTLNYGTGIVFKEQLPLESIIAVGSFSSSFLPLFGLVFCLALLAFFLTTRRQLHIHLISVLFSSVLFWPLIKMNPRRQAEKQTGS